MLFQHGNIDAQEPAIIGPAIPDIEEKSSLYNAQVNEY